MAQACRKSGQRGKVASVYVRERARETETESSEVAK
jgi:hypothetical protein